jgi:hypothetical protein
MKMETTEFNGRRVVFRLPYTMTTEVVVKGEAKGVTAKDTDLMHRMDKPFEVQRIMLRLTGLDTDGRVLDPQPTVLDRLVKVRLTDVSKNERISNDLPFRRLPGGEAVWAPSAPIVMVRTEGFEAMFETRKFELAAPDTPDAKASSLALIRVQLSLEGETLVLAPSMEVE